ncbi:hypothetical protein CDAR_521921 [Caerostris darwini]|uniref:Uncharacterized protein n=1 Tax=Caerostris darwini TaxID=1538125 RepID=A0AAV4P1V3_9ARAC|nr:hypothetical protein CDAR_521921 [Caerostris darwini]
MRGGSGGLGTEAECSDFEDVIPLGKQELFRIFCISASGKRAKTSSFGGNVKETFKIGECGSKSKSRDLSEYQSSLNPHSLISLLLPSLLLRIFRWMDGGREEKCPDGIFYLVSTPSGGCVEEVEVLERKRNVRISKL